MNLFKRGAALGVLSLMGLACIGCGQDVDQGDVNAAREDVREEMRETAQVEQEGREAINEEERETAETRHEVLKPNTEDIREEKRETAEARKDAAEAVNEEQKETAEAKQELNEKEAKLNAQKARDAYVAENQTLLKTAATRIEQLETVADDQEGAVKEATEKQIDELQAAHDKLEEAIDDMKSADPLKWQTEKADVEAARKALEQELEEAK